MAILENRVKDRGAFASLIVTLFSACRKFSALFFILLSFQLMYSSSRSDLEWVNLQIAGKIIEPINAISTSIGEWIMERGNSINYFHNLKEENIALNLEISRLRKIEEKLIALKSENLSLKHQLNFVSEPGYDFILTKVISVSTSIYGDSAIIHAGSKEGVWQDQIIINDKGLVGRVKQVSKSFSQAMLITDFGSRIPVISSNSRLRAVVAGTGDKAARLLYFTDNSSLRVGETLLTSGDGRMYPAGIPVARVIKIDGEDVYVMPLALTDKIDFVSLIMSYESSNK